MKVWKIISRDGCIYCTRAKSLFAVNGIDFVEDNRNTDEEKRAFVAEGHETFPQIYHGDHHVGGYTELRAYIDKGQF